MVLYPMVKAVRQIPREIAFPTVLSGVV